MLRLDTGPMIAGIEELRERAEATATAWAALPPVLREAVGPVTLHLDCDGGAVLVIRCRPTEAPDVTDQTGGRRDG